MHKQVSLHCYNLSTTLFYFFRTLVREIISIRKTTYSKIKRSQSIDIFIEQFLNNRIKPLWPVGWMKVANIVKELKVKEKDSRYGFIFVFII